VHTVSSTPRSGWPRAARAASAGLGVAALVASMVTDGTAAATRSGPASAAFAGATAMASSAPEAAWSGSHPSRSSTHVTGQRVVSLVTGDKVAVTSWSDGRTSARLLPGSPSVGKPVRTLGTPADTYVIPELPARRLHRLDPSVFDISRLAELQRSSDGGIPVVVTFAKGAPVHSLPGIRVDAASATKIRSGALVARGSYPTSSTHPTLNSRWHGVTKVALPRPATQAQAPYVLRTLTVRMLDAKGRPTSDLAWVQNVVDGRLFSAPVFVFKGVAKVEVPEGPYSVIGGSFSTLVIRPEVTVAGDRTVTLDARDATVKATVTVPGNVVESLDVSLIRTSRRGDSFTWETSGERHLRLSPAPAHPAHGALITEIGATLTTKAGLRSQDPTARLVFTKDVLLGIPAAIAIRHPRSDFATVQHRYFANGPERSTSLYEAPVTRFDFFVFVFGIPATLGTSRTLWLQGGRGLSWFQAVDAFFNFSTFQYAEMQATRRSYRAGDSATLPFLRGPVGPGLERGIDGERTGRRCLLCREGDLLHGVLPLMSSAGTDMFGFVSGSSVGSWKLAAGRRTLDHGTFGILPRVSLAARTRRYTLTASSHPDLRKWRLSTDVTDRWGFTSGAGTAVVPLLVPSYVPTNHLDGDGGSGRQHFRLDFDNIGPQAARVSKARVEYSVLEHGGWRSATLTRLDANSFRVSYPNPFQPAGRNVNLRVTGHDAKGRTVRETATHAYRVSRPASAAAARSSTASAPTTARRSTVAWRSTTAPAAAAAGTAAAAVSSVPAPAAAGTALAAGSGGRNRWPGLAKEAVPACGPVKAHQARCYALIDRRGQGALTKSGDPRGYNAIDLRDAYGLDSVPDSGQTVAVVVAYDYPSAEADMNAYRHAFGLPRCTQGSGCFTKINQRGQTRDYPSRDQGWAVEAALDLQMISASCPTCHIVLAEADQPSTGALNKATDAAVAAGADVTNHSYGIQEYTGIRGSNRHYSVDGVTAVSSSGDNGYQPATFPASSPDVVSVGGTVLRHSLNARGWAERAWAYGGSGCSAYFPKPRFQTDRACGNRTIADLSAVADAVAVYDTFLPKRYRGWVEVSGTSISSPFVAGMIGAAGAGGIKPGDLYGRPRAFHDIAAGANGFCLRNYICTAKPGYDGPTGWGTPRGLRAFLGAALHR
jgi:hypothetical protein